MSRSILRLWALMLGLGPCLPALAQPGALLHDTLRAQAGDTLRLRAANLLPFSDTLRNARSQILPPTSYQLLPGGYLLLHAAPDSLLIFSYRRGILPESLFLRDLRVFEDSARREARPDYLGKPEKGRDEQAFWEESDGIAKSGSLTRGITVGNNRSLSLSSGLRLQMEGDLGDGLKIVGNITDENIPLQPDGSTQQLADLERIFIRLSKSPYEATIGDFEEEMRQTRFANYYRNVQGLRFRYDNGPTRVRLSSSVAKGKFHSNTLAAREGVAGPYRLSGRNGERFFIVLAGSERVYVNGSLVQRGENLDYVINYNTAEITFTARVTITNITRIVVDFEYNDRYYNRSLITAQAEQQLAEGKLRLRASWARDADNDGAPFDDPALFRLIRDTLAAAGDNPLRAVSSGVSAVGYSATEPRYERRDTLIGSQTYVRYLRSRDPAAAIYALRFSFVGEGAGFYEPDPGDNANVFRWVPPGPDGKPRGAYAPLRSWVLPRILEVGNLQAEWQISRRLRLLSESGVSIEDKNRLSPLDDGDNRGLAQRAALQLDRLPLADSLLLSAEASYQFVGQTYTNLDRLYKAEYGRVWDFDENAPRRDEQVAQAQVKLSYRGVNELQAEAGYRQYGPQERAFRQAYTLSRFSPKGPGGSFTLTDIRSEQDSARRRGRWTRYEGDLYLGLGTFRPGAVIWIENRSQSAADTLTKGSFAFWDIKPYLRIRRGRKLESELSWNYRFDREWQQGLRDKSLGQTLALRADYRPGPSAYVLANLSWRRLDVLDTLFRSQGLDDARTVNGSVQASLADKKRIASANFVYEVSSEQLARREIRYLEVNPGQGEYVWLDSLFNQDGVQDIEEFQLANNPLIANFIRVVVPTRELFPATRVGATGNLSLDLRRLWPDSVGGLRWLLRQFRSTSTLRVSNNRARSGEGGWQSWNPFLPLSDSSLLDGSGSFRQDLSLFQGSPVGDLRFSWTRNQSRLFLATGDEQRGQEFFTFSQRLNLGSSRSIEVDTRSGLRYADAAAFPARNYFIRFFETQPRVNFQFGRKLRLTAGYEYKRRINEPEGGALSRVRIHQLSADARWNIRERNNLFARLELASLKQEGSPGFAAEYEMREGLKPGLNAVLRSFATWYLLSNVELSLTYEGRFSAEAPPVHTGRVQVRALF